ncbi:MULTISPECIES: hypothetical protein [Streptomyces]|uniref:hypothetical protein n=1 Tax=Streptomyces TaxID=1883 RepID=UPI001319E041|nr:MULTISPECIES: hypothetical protein [Streptomyces]MBZ6111074.1 hypothetical protein [Streptomyces olivaceus]MBZ6145410.1 hypothetical protein [Streptomyces olivaceus]MBZ6159584.1 hypothetical protein [Streptomyces olivaceus]MBZ6187361.1 hypothetical protein [Streptomyces olivaceus]MBZ6215130.1 hypothetical protein [Streptomyces olivaceus]
MIRSGAVPTNGLSPVYDETGAASARFLLWLREETGETDGHRVASSAYAHHERCTLELVEDVVERLAALGWITVHNDSGAVPPLVSPTTTGLDEAGAWDEAYDDRESRRRYAKAALFAWWDRVGQYGDGGSGAEDFLWAREAFYCGRQLAFEDLDYAKDHLDLPAPMQVGVMEQGAGVFLSFEQLARLVQASRPDLSESDSELRQVRDLAAALTDASRSGAEPDPGAVERFLEHSRDLVQAGSRSVGSMGRDMASGMLSDLLGSLLRLG